MANSRRPWFPFYARDWLTDDKVMLMGLECQGAYLRLLCVQWENGSIPKEPEDVAVLLGFQTFHSKASFVETMWPILKGHFPVVKRERKNRRLLNLREAANVRAGFCSKAAKKGWSQRKLKKRLSKQAHSKRNASHTSHQNPQTPTAVGAPEFSAGKSDPGSRSAGTNPRALAASEVVEAELAEFARRAALIRKLEAAGQQGGAYVRNRGFAVWTMLTTAELEKLSKRVITGE